MKFVDVGSDIKIAYDEVNRNGKKTVLMIHGWPFTHKIFEYQKVLLTKMGYHVITVDLRGFGDSDTTENGYSYIDMATDIYMVVNCLGLNNFILVGFSMGGAVAIRYMSMYNGYGVSKLFLLAAAAPCFVQCPSYPYGITREKINDIIEKACVDRAQMAKEFLTDFFALSHSDAIKNWFHSICMDASAIGTIKAAITLREEDLRPDLHAIHVPTFILHGKRDLICPYEFALILNKYIENSKLIPFENSGHGIFYDELELFNERFLECLESDR